MANTNTKKTANTQTENANATENTSEVVSETASVNTTETVAETAEKKTIEEKAVENNTAEKTQSSIDAISKVIDDVSGVKEEEKPVMQNEIGLNERIAVRSVTYGELVWISPKTNAHYCWKDIGSVEYIQFDELVTMNNTSQAFLTQPYVILKDERVVEYFRLSGIYEKIKVVDELPELIKEGDLSKIEKALGDIRSTNMRNVAISKIKELRRSRTLNNIDVIRLIEKKLCFDME